jgi:hypothetical protein
VLVEAKDQGNGKSSLIRQLPPRNALGIDIIVKIGTLRIEILE